MQLISKAFTEKFALERAVEIVKGESYCSAPDSLKNVHEVKACKDFAEVNLPIFLASYLNELDVSGDDYCMDWFNVICQK